MTKSPQKLPDMPDKNWFHSGCTMLPCSTCQPRTGMQHHSSPRREFPLWNFLLLLTSRCTMPKVNKKLCWPWQNYVFSGKSAHSWALGWISEHNGGGKSTREGTDAVQHIYTWKCILYPIQWPYINTVVYPTPVKWVPLSRDVRYCFPHKPECNTSSHSIPWHALSIPRQLRLKEPLVQSVVFPCDLCCFECLTYTQRYEPPSLCSLMLQSLEHKSFCQTDLLLISSIVCACCRSVIGCWCVSRLCEEVSGAWLQPRLSTCTIPPC